MPDRRIRVPRKHEAFIDRLRTDSAIPGAASGPFETIADVMAFAAAWAARNGRWSEIDPGSRDPIRPEVFGRRSGYEALFYLLAFHKTQDMEVFAGSTEMEERRAEIFEGYVQGGLDHLESKLRGATDFTEEILTLIKVDVTGGKRENQEFDIRDFLGG